MVGRRRNGPELADKVFHQKINFIKRPKMPVKLSLRPLLKNALYIFSDFALKHSGDILKVLLQCIKKFPDNFSFPFFFLFSPGYNFLWCPRPIPPPSTQPPSPSNCYHPLSFRWKRKDQKRLFKGFFEIQFAYRFPIHATCTHSTHAFGTFCWCFDWDKNL